MAPELRHEGAGKALSEAWEDSAQTAELDELRLEGTRTARDFDGRHGFLDMRPPQDGWRVTCYPIANSPQRGSPGPES